MVGPKDQKGTLQPLQLYSIDQDVAYLSICACTTGIECQDGLG